MERVLLTSEEIELLALLHELVPGFEKADAVPIGLIVERLYHVQHQLPRALAFLEGVGHITVVKGSNGIDSVSLTLKGEIFVRSVEAALARDHGRNPGVPLTSSYLEEAGGELKERIIAQVQRFLTGAKPSTPERT